MIPCYNKLLQSCPTLFLGLNAKILAKVVKCEISQNTKFSENSANGSFLSSFDILKTLRDIKSSAKLPNPLLRAERQDSGKSCKMRNFAKY